MRMGWFERVSRAVDFLCRSSGFKESAAMHKPISRLIHGWIDYTYVAAVATAPALLKFEGDSRAALFCRALSASVLASSVCTRAEWGFARLIPFRVHLALDASVSTFNLAAPWLLGFWGNRRARNLSIALGLIGLAAVALTQPEEMA